jgi:hypothetical protein
MAAGTLSATGSALTLGGITAPAGAALSMAAPILGLTGGMLTDGLKRRQRLRTVERVLHMKERISRFRAARTDRQDLNDRDIKRILLTRMGFRNYKDVYRTITINRANSLAKAANWLNDTGNDDDPRIAASQKAEEALEAMGLHPGGFYDPMAVARKLGLH